MPAGRGRGGDAGAHARRPGPRAGRWRSWRPSTPRQNFVRPRGEDARAGEAAARRRARRWASRSSGLLAGPGDAHGAGAPPPAGGHPLDRRRAVPRRRRAPEGRIVDTNAAALALAVRRAGGMPTLLGIARDTPRGRAAQLWRRAQGYDVVLTSAGVSVGEHDFVQAALEELGVEMDFWRVAIKPGKPLAVGPARGDAGSSGCPGNPTSSLVTFELFVRPALLRLVGWPSAVPVPSAGPGAASISRRTGAGALRPGACSAGERGTSGPDPLRHPDVGCAALRGHGHASAALSNGCHESRLGVTPSNSCLLRGVGSVSNGGLRRASQLTGRTR